MPTQIVTEDHAVVLENDDDASDMCADERGLPDDEGNLPGERGRKNTCGLPLSFSASSLGGGLTGVGSWFDWEGIYGIQLPNGAELGTDYACHPGKLTTILTRKFSFEYDEPPEVERYGVKCLNKGGRFVYIAQDGKVFGYYGGRYTFIQSVGDAPETVAFTIRRKGHDGVTVDGEPDPPNDVYEMSVNGGEPVVFNDPEHPELLKYWRPDGTCKLYFEGKPSDADIEFPLGSGEDKYETPLEHFIEIRAIKVEDEELPDEEE